MTETLDKIYETWEQMEARHFAERQAKMLEVAKDAYRRGNGKKEATKLYRKLDQIVSFTAAKHDLPVAGLLGDCRRQKFAHPRFEAFHLAKQAGYSLSEIGRFFKRDHSTISHGIERFQEISQ